MAWNDDQDKKDPWSTSGDQGPPDLDDVFRKFKSQLGGLFGGSGSGGNGDGSDGVRRFLTPSMLIFGLLALVIIYAMFGLYQVDQQERGVVFRLGKVQNELRPPGLRWNWPIIDVVEMVNITRVNSSEHSGQMLTEDENIVSINLVVQYVVRDALLYAVEIRNPRESLRHATESALRHVVGSSMMDAVITEGREALGFEVQDRLQSYVDRYLTGIRVVKVNIDSVGPPAEVQDAFDDVQKAKEDEVKFINQANAYAESIVPEARGEAQQLIEEANAYRDKVIALAQGEAERFLKLLAEYQQAEDVTRNRLYIEAMESVMTNTNKVVVDVEASNNMLYLPLDQIRRAAAGSSVSQDTGSDGSESFVSSVGRRTNVGR
ncbi:MAG: FtsH protease activity modulator HflK [Gammaproteobacteria bacterium]|nr:FtsH protease activity modulator HflK [Gammaproteobacteria bacterium]